MESENARTQRRDAANAAAGRASTTNAKTLDKDPGKFQGGMGLDEGEEPPPPKTAKPGMPLADFAKASKADREAYSAWSSRRSAKRGGAVEKALR